VSAAPTFKGGFGYHPILVFLDNTHEALAGILRPGNAGGFIGGWPDRGLVATPQGNRDGSP
jgi:hypothetical protein